MNHFNRSVHKNLWIWSKGIHGSLVVICILNILISISTLFISVMTRSLIDGAGNHEMNTVITCACALVILVVLIRILSYMHGIIQTKSSALLLKNIRNNTMKQLMHKQYGSLNTHHSGEMVNRLFSDVNVVRNGIMDIIPGFVSLCVSFTGAAIILITMDYRFALAPVLAGCMGMIVMIVLRKDVQEKHRKAQENEGKVHALIQESIENIRIIKAGRSENKVLDSIYRIQDDYEHALNEKGTFNVMMNNGVNLLFHMGWLFCMLWGCYGIYHGTLTYGMLAAIIQLVAMIQNPIAQSAGLAGQYFNTLTSAQRIKEIIELPNEIESEEIDDCDALKCIDLKNVSFHYGREETDVLQDVNVTVNTGDFVCVTGVSGSGKSTLFQLLLGIYTPTDGRITFDFDHKSVSAGVHTRKLFSYVPQGNTLFSGTIRDNLTLFAENLNDEMIHSVIHTACINDFIDEMKDGLDTIIGERGIGLSEGQAQRIAIGRALLSNAPILLLDECTSALDENTEARLLFNLSELKNKTCLIVTHRKAAMKICDYQLDVENRSVTRKEI